MKVAEKRSSLVAAEVEDSRNGGQCQKGVYEVGYVVKVLCERLGNLPPYVKAVLLFGSTARGEATDRSDIDLLVLHEGMPVANLVERRRILYRAVVERVGDVFEAVTLIDMGFRDFVNPGVVTPLLLNIYWDAVIIFDRTGLLEEFLVRVRRRIEESGLRRSRDGRAYYWVLPKPMERVRIV